LPDNERSQADIPGSDQIGMEGEAAVLADKEQAVPGTILSAGVATARAALAGVVGINRDTDAARQGGFVGQQSAEFRKRPAGGMAIRFARFGGNGNKLFSLAAFPATFRPFANA
jgi:hypothetical protein